MRKALPVALALVFLAAPEVSFASGFKVNEQDAKAAGMGLAFTGQADDPGALATNIAGIGQLEGMQVSTTTALLYVPGREFESHLTTELADQQADNQLFVLPSMYLTAQIGCDSPIHAGLAVYSMYGLTQDWNLTGSSPVLPPLPLAGFSRDVDRVVLKTGFINPVVAYEVMPGRVTLAAGLIAAYGKIKIESNPVAPAGASLQEIAQLEQEADGWAWSWNVAIHANLCPRGVLLRPDARTGQQPRPVGPRRKPARDHARRRILGVPLVGRLRLHARPRRHSRREQRRPHIPEPAPGRGLQLRPDARLHGDDGAEVLVPGLQFRPLAGRCPI